MRVKTGSLETSILIQISQRVERFGEIFASEMTLNFHFH